jgi:hypothetical protein
VVEETIKAIKKDELDKKMELATAKFANDYKKDKDLTAFTTLDFEDFYETKGNLAR